MGPEMKLGGFTGIPSPQQVAEYDNGKTGDEAIKDCPIPKPPNVFYDWQQRVVDERKELEEKVNKLKNFIVHPTFSNIPKEDRRLLVDQYDIMTHYLKVLTKRIVRFKP